MLLFFGFEANSFGQPILFMPNANHLKGGTEGKSYQLELTSTVEKRELVDVFIKELDEWGICDKKELQDRIDEIDDQTKEFTVEFNILFPMFLTRLMGVSIGEPALWLSGELYFEFFQDSIVTIDFKNWEEYTFLRYNDEAENFDLTKIQDPALSEWMNYYGNKIMQNTILYKSLALTVGVFGFIDPGIDNKEMANELRSYLRKNWYENWNQEYPHYEKLQELNLAGWISDSLHLYYYLNTPTRFGFSEKQKNTVAEIYTTKLQENKLISLSQNRWEKQVRELLSDFFKIFALETKCKVNAVGEDGIATYCNIDGYILPVDPKWPKSTDGSATPIPPSDPKARAKYIKSNLKNHF